MALVLVIEGLLWAGFPERMKVTVRQMLELPASVLRRGGLIAMSIGVVIVWWVRG